ncbi:MAG: hypothetical protein DMG41_16940 [Acidobacteria bacterium]|nr:MAG: hypothetical protein AUH13_06710 [Acidobacteria bacterium 13_2_20CM_58_27]PYT67713.1 MAG: hypothetical protein DMG42_26090 [Acidobacteriota bacterium]PYT87040.1 MAG: hypothetical protein DMG41_16940 [Acidobacteriota bacterium]
MKGPWRPSIEEKRELDFEIQRGARFVLFPYCSSIVLHTFRRALEIYFLRQGESAHKPLGEYRKPSWFE